MWVTMPSASLLLGRRTRPVPFTSGDGYRVVAAHPLQHQERGAPAPAVGHQMRASRADRSPALARSQIDLFVGIAQGDPHVAVQDVEGVLDAGVVMPGNPLGGTHPQL